METPDRPRTSGAAVASASTGTAEESYHLLIVEDSDTQAMRLRLHFEAKGWRVSRAATGQEMRALLEERVSESGPSSPFDLVLLDYHLPDALGDELVREIREDTRIWHLPILLLTASVGEDTELRSLRSGADDYVSKAAPVDVLLARLDTLLRKSRAHAELSDLYEREHRVAQVLQESLLSAAPPDAFPGLAIHMAYVPAWDEAQIGGDFYDIRSVGKGKASLMVGDVVGKGLQAATFTAEVKYALRAFLHEYPLPGDALTRLNDFLVEHGEQNPWANNAFVAICLAVCEAETGQVQLAASGAEPPMLLRCEPGTSAILAEEVSLENGMMLGVLGGQTLETRTLSLEHGDTLLFFTDGITEARQRRGPLLGYEGVAAVARRVLQTHCNDLAALVHSVVAEAKRVSGGRLLDDACVLAVQRR